MTTNELGTILSELAEAPAAVATDPDTLLATFTGWAESNAITLYPAQEEALIEVMTGANVIVATPTGSGKSLIATGAHFAALARGERSYYTAPIKALVSEKFFALCDIFGAERVGMVTGDASVNPDAPIICATAEILANRALREGMGCDVGQVVMDEFHYYSDPQRGWAWQVPLIELPQAQFILMSATLGDVTELRADLTERTERPTAHIAGTVRPVPLTYSYARTPLHDTIAELASTHRAPIYIVHFTQAAAIEQAQALTSLPLADRAAKDAIAAEIGNFAFTTGFGRTLSRLLRSGIGVHHAGMLPRYRRLVERLAQRGLLAVICGTDTLGVGINVPIRTVLLTTLVKYDGHRTRHLRAREFHQIVGRAGRAGFDTTGSVVLQAPEHEVENARLEARAAGDPKKAKRIQKKKPAEGTVNYGEATFERLIAAEPEPMQSRFEVTHSMLLNVVARPGNCLTAMRHLLERNHEPRGRQLKHAQTAITLYRGLRNGGVVEQLTEPDEYGRWARLTVDLPANFALNQPLSAFAVAALELLDPEDPDYPLDVISVIEATLEDPRQVVQGQERAARNVAMAEMKADGIEYDERIARLDEISWPKPLEAELSAAYTTYAGTHPWVRQFHLAPKSVVRNMIETGMNFSELISRYQLARSEGTVLRYLSDAYRALAHTVPPAARTDEVREYTEWLGAVVRAVDSSLVDEWEALQDGTDAAALAAAVSGSGTATITSNRRAFQVMVRNKMFALIRAFDDEDSRTLTAAGPDADWEGGMDAYYADYDTVDTGPVGRGKEFFRVTERAGEYLVRQVIVDPAGDHGFAITARVDLEASDETAEVVLTDVDLVTG